MYSLDRCSCKLYHGVNHQVRCHKMRQDASLDGDKDLLHAERIGCSSTGGAFGDTVKLG